MSKMHIFELNKENV